MIELPIIVRFGFTRMLRLHLWLKVSAVFVLLHLLVSNWEAAPRHQQQQGVMLSDWRGFRRRAVCLRPSGLVKGARNEG